MYVCAHEELKNGFLAKDSIKKMSIPDEKKMSQKSLKKVLSSDKPKSSLRIFTFYKLYLLISTF